MDPVLADDAVPWVDRLNFTSTHKGLQACKQYFHKLRWKGELAHSMGWTLLLGGVSVVWAWQSSAPSLGISQEGRGWTYLGPCGAAVGIGALGLSVAFAEHVPVAGLACPGGSSSTVQIGHKIE